MQLPGRTLTLCMPRNWVAICNGEVSLNVQAAELFDTVAVLVSDARNGHE
jgi:hypothetical protein